MTETNLQVGGWGRDVAPMGVGGHRGLGYVERRHHVGDLMVDARRWAERDHVVHGPRRYTFAEVDAASQRVAHRLRALGVAPGAHVMLAAANSPEWVVAFWGAVQLGAVPVLANAWWSSREIDQAVRLVEPAVALADERRRGVIAAGSTQVVAMEELRVELDADPGPPIECPRRSEHDPAVILFTSGTIGAAKAAVLSHRAVIANQQSLLLTTGRLPSELTADHPGTVSLMTLPLFHMGGLQTICSTLLTGGTMVFLDGRFDPSVVLELIETERVRIWGTVPTMLARVLDHPDVARRDTTSLRSLTIGGSSVPPELVRRARAAFPRARRSVGTIYGLTESGGTLTAVTGDGFADRPGCVGRPMPVVELRIADSDEHGVGEILARSPACMSGYLAIEESPIDTDGWLHTGDLGRLDADGSLFVVGRSKDVIIRGGENVAASHVESCLTEHPDVETAAVVGLPDDDLGEVVAAVVVARPGRAPTVGQLAAFAARHLAHFEVPTRWWLTAAAELPTNATGKVLKSELVRRWPIGT